MRISQWPKSVEAKWYLGVKCQKCRTPILFALDRTEGEGRPAPPAKLFLTCPQAECKHQADYSAAAVSRFKKGPDAPNETKKGDEGKPGRGPKR